MTRLALVGAALALAGSGLTITMAGVASASGSPTVMLSPSGPYANGQTITVSGTGFPTPSSNPSGLEIIQCESSVLTAPDPGTSYCDGSTLNPLPVNTNSSGDFTTVYTISSLSTAKGSNINCTSVASCVLWVGTDFNNDFSDPANQAYSSSFTIQPPAFTSASSTTFAEGAASSFSITATGNPTPAITESGALPSGITFAGGAGSATLSGTTYAAPGTYPITLSANDGFDPATTQSFTLTVGNASSFLIVPASAGTATVGQPYSFQLTAEGPYTAPVKWKESGKLPKGLKLNKATGVISGTPTASKHTKFGAYPFTASVKDHSKPKQSASQSFTITLDS
jgi:hypothetical protein